MNRRPPTSPPNARALAARAIARVLRGSSLDDALAQPAIERLADAPFCKALAYGVLREHSLLAYLCNRLLDKPLANDEELHALLLAGLHQLRAMDVAPHAAVHETVQAAAVLKRDAAAGLVNAVLRRYQRERGALEAALPTDLATRWSHPAWLVEQIGRDWGAQAPALLEANNRQGPLTLRVNRRALARDAYLQRLAEMNIAAEAVRHCPDAVALAQARPVDKVPGFNSGQVSVQDAAAQLAVELLDLADGLSVCDACAAPGGKTAHMLERHALAVTSIDSDPRRLIRVDENLRRLKLAAKLVAGDAGEPARWWDGRPFDRILLDAPCSGTGVIRRHPDIKWLRRPTDVPTLAATQLRLLRGLWPTLKPGGRLVYATCSVLRAEGDDVIGRFRLLGEGVRVQPIEAPWGEATEFGRRLPPGNHYDGFYYAVLTRA